MKIRYVLRQQIKEMSAGSIVSVSDFDIPREYRGTLVKALNQFEEQGIIKRSSKGMYYKPKQSIFGELMPSEAEFLKEFLVKDGKIIGYITGTRAFADLGLTTQISKDVTIGSNVERRPTTRGSLRISFLTQPNPITEENIPLLVILDALRLIKEIPASTPDALVSNVVALIKPMSEEQKLSLLSLCRAYRPYVRALVGAIFEAIGSPTSDLIDTLNPISTYHLGLSPSLLPTLKTWNIL